MQAPLRLHSSIDNNKMNFSVQFFALSIILFCLVAVEGRKNALKGVSCDQRKGANDECPSYCIEMHRCNKNSTLVVQSICVGKQPNECVDCSGICLRMKSRTHKCQAELSDKSCNFTISTNRTHGPKESNVSRGSRPGPKPRGPKESNVSRGSRPRPKPNGPKESNVSCGSRPGPKPSGPKESNVSRGSRPGPKPNGPKESNMSRGSRPGPKPNGPKESNMSRGSRPGPKPNGPKESNMSRGSKPRPKPSQTKPNVSRGSKPSPKSNPPTPTTNPGNRLNPPTPNRPQQNESLLTCEKRGCNNSCVETKQRCRHPDSKEVVAHSVCVNALPEACKNCTVCLRTGMKHECQITNEESLPLCNDEKKPEGRPTETPKPDESKEGGSKNKEQKERGESNKKKGYPKKN